MGLVLSEEEATVLYNLLYRGVVGDENGPRGLLTGKGSVLAALQSVGINREYGISVKRTVDIDKE